MLPANGGGELLDMMICCVIGVVRRVEDECGSDINVRFVRFFIVGWSENGGGSQRHQSKNSME